MRVARYLIFATILLVLFGSQFSSSPPSVQAAITIVAGAGDITDTGSQGVDTANQINADPAAQVVTLGDNQYPDGCLSAFNSAGGYSGSWGTFLAKTHPSIGNHDSHDTACASNGSGYFDYFNGVGNNSCSTTWTSTCKAGSRSQGFYSYDLGDWHFIALNSECNTKETSGSTNQDFCNHSNHRDVTHDPAAGVPGNDLDVGGTSQIDWLRADLLHNPKSCTLAYWHRPIFAPSSTHTDDEGHFTNTLAPDANGNTDNVWQILYDYGVDVVLQGHDHLYAAFPRLNRAANATDLTGIRSFVVGTGGSSRYTATAPNGDSPIALDALDSSSQGNEKGIIKLTLNPSDYSWQFLSADGTYNGTGSPTGNDSCRPSIVDADQDQWPTSHETYMGTNPASGCGVNSWPPDFNDDGYADGTDITILSGSFGKHVPDQAPARRDIAPVGAPDTYVDGTDNTVEAGFFGKTCLVNYYIDSACAGCDTNGNDGLSTVTPWQTTNKVNTLSSQAGKSFLFKSGGTYGQLLLNTANLTRVDKYGGTARPIFTTNGGSNCVEVNNAQNTTVSNIQVQNCSTPLTSAYYGIKISGATSQNVALNSIYATGNIAGVGMVSGLATSTFTTVTNSFFVDNNVMNVNDAAPDNDSGAFGMLVNGGKLLFEDNTCSGQDAASIDYGRDGGCVEFFGGGAGSIVRRNTATSNDSFSETDTVGGITYVQNSVLWNGAHATGFNVRGDSDIFLSNTVSLPTDGTHGPITDVNRGAQAFICSGPRPPEVTGCTNPTFRNNIFIGGWKAAFVNSTPGIISEGYDLFKATLASNATQGFTAASTDLVQVDPLLCLSNTNRHEQTVISPTIDVGDPTALESGYSAPSGFPAKDADGTLVPTNARRDIGADEDDGRVYC